MTLDRSIGPRCNIGAAELARRRRSAFAFTGIAVVVALGLVALDVPAAARLAVFPFAAAAGINWMQVTHRFCVAFGAFGLENFGRIGAQRAVDQSQRTSDRRRAAQLALEGSAIGALVTLGLMLLPV